MRLTHLMPANRLKEDYLMRLVEGIGYSGAIMDHYRNPAALAQGWSLKSLIKKLVRLCMMTGRERRFYFADRRGRRRGLQHLARCTSMSPAAKSCLGAEKIGVSQ